MPSAILALAFNDDILSRLKQFGIAPYLLVALVLGEIAVVKVLRDLPKLSATCLASVEAALCNVANAEA